ncbi:MAG: alpha/beta hydrolase [Candidatus Latescibacteria bacterium]|nr:alpha/beta hydrolase [Candidatus Latescibacterota bacterium]
MPVNDAVEYGHTTLKPGIRSRFVENGNGLTLHCLEAGDPAGPTVLLLHGFPELAYSWRHVLLPLADSGYHVIAPDQRGYGRTTGWDPDYDGDPASYRMLNLVRDTVGLVHALGRDHVAAVVGHDFGSPVAAWCTLTHPDVFRSVVLMSSPFGGPPAAPLPSSDVASIHEDLAALPAPRKHYQWYYSTREANEDMWRCPQGVHDFLRAYYNYKSADWAQNRPHPLEAWTATELARMPKYYVMDLDKGMAETVASEMPAPSTIEPHRWLTDDELRVYSGEYERTGFQGGLQWYRCATGKTFRPELRAYAGRTIDVPCSYIAGKSDWGTFQSPGSFERMQTDACTAFQRAHLIDGAGHWVQQEQPETVCRILTRNHLPKPNRSGA